MSLYRKDINTGGWFSFNSTQKDWVSHYADFMLKHFFDIDFINRGFGGYKITEEILLTNNIDFSNLKGKKILVIGGGPSSNSLDSKKIDSYDYVFSCNHFFKNSLLKKQKVNLCLIGDEVDLDSKEFNQYLSQFSPIVGFEHSGKRSIQQLVKFRRRYKKCFVYLTRYFSRLGYVPRAIVMAALASPNRIDYIGLDGFKKGAYVHSFEPNKSPPPFNEAEMFKAQMRIFLKYLLKDIKIQKDALNDLGASHPLNIYTGMLEDIKSEKN